MNDETETLFVQSSGELTFVDRDCRHLASSPPEIVYAYNGSSADPHLVGTLLSATDNANSVTLAVSGPIITVTGAVALPNDAVCCPSAHLTKSYTYATGVLTYVRGSVQGPQNNPVPPVVPATVVGDGRGIYCVSGVAANDTLYVHPAAGAQTPTIGYLAPFACNVQDLGHSAYVGGGLWVAVRAIGSGLTGWVNSSFLTLSRTR